MLLCCLVELSSILEPRQSMYSTGAAAYRVELSSILEPRQSEATVTIGGTC